MSFPSKNLFPKYVAMMWLLALPASTNYKLHNFGFGAGGEDGASSTNYRLNATTGEVSGTSITGSNYGIGPGLIYTQQANVPPAPALTNPDNYYNKLKLVISTGSNPSDALFAVAISADNFVADTRYVQSDNTVGNTLGTEDYQTFAAWGGASGENIIGLLPGTTYYVKVKAIHGDFTETDYGPAASVATSQPQLSFDIDVSSNDTNTDPPFTLSLGSIAAGTIVTGSDKIWVDLATNGTSGGKVYVRASNAGLNSNAAAYTITSASANLTSASEGFGAQGDSATQSSGGPLTITSPYDGSSETVGVTDATIREIFTTSNPITAGRGSFLIKAKASSVTPAASDYTEILTVIASASF